MAEPSPPSEEAAKKGITTVTCKDCGEVYVQGDSEDSKHHICPAASEWSNLELNPTQTEQLPAEATLPARDPARLVGQYILVQQIGKGGMGTVWKAWDRSLSRWVAIKFLAGTSDDEVGRFTREAKVAASVRHANIAAIYEIGMARGQYFIAMEFIDGVVLPKYQAPVRELVEAMRQVTLAIAAAHKIGVIHRDIKPANVMVTTQGRPVVLDFGLAKQIKQEQGISISGLVLGTPAFMPPEQAKGQTSQVDARSDVYSLGATMYAAVTRKDPFTGESPMAILMKVIQEEPVDPKKLFGKCPDDLSTIILKAMEKEPDRRYQTAAELAADLERYLKDEPIVARPPTIRYKLRKSVKRHRAVYALAILLIALALVIVIQMGRSSTVVGGPDIAGFQKLWNPVRRGVSLLDFGGPVDPAAFDKAFRKLAELGPDEVKGVTDWFGEQTRAAEQKIKDWRGDRRRWIEQRPEEMRIAAWTQSVIAVLGRLEVHVKSDALKDLRARLSTLGAEAAAMAAYQGQATLLIHVAPYARVKSLTSGEIVLVKDGAPAESPDVKFPDPDLTTPVRLVDVEIRDYALVLEHPEFGSRTVLIRADQMKNGAEHVISGHMAAPDSITLKSER